MVRSFFMLFHVNVEKILKKEMPKAPQHFTPLPVVFIAIAALGKVKIALIPKSECATVLDQNQAGDCR